MAITDLASLRTSIVAWSERSDVSSDVLNDCVQLTTAMLNTGSAEIAPLRTREMMEVATLTPTDGICTLPTDYLQYRRVVCSVSQRRNLEYMTPAFVDDQYPGAQSGIPSNFTIIGDSLYIYPLNDADVELSYFKKVPELVDETDTNWVLEKHPGVYLHGSLFYLAAFVRDDALQARSLGLMSSLIEGIRGTDMTANYASAASFPRGIVIA